MAQAIAIHTTSRFHNLSDGALADALGHADACLKGADAECKALKDEFKRRGLAEAAGSNFTVTATEQISGRGYEGGEGVLGRDLSSLRDRRGCDCHPHQGCQAACRGSLKSPHATTE